MPKQINNIHDKFVKQMLSDKELAIAFFHENLPQKVLQLINIESLEYLNVSYINSKLNESFSDIVFRFESEKGHLKICLLLEHKSYIASTAAFQLLEYLALGYQTQLKNNSKLELIIPVIYYHGQKKWVYRDFAYFFDGYPDSLKAYLPSFKNEFIDLSNMSTNQIMNLGNGILRSALLIQRHYNDPKALNDNLLNIVNSLNPYLEKNFIQSIFVYLFQNTKFEPKDLKKAVAEFPKDINNKIMSLYDELIHEGIEKGKLEGKIEGKIEGKLEGKIEGKIEGKEEVILNAFDKGYKIIDLIIITGFTEEKVIEILKLNNRL